MKFIKQIDYKRYFPIVSIGAVLGAIDLPTVISFAILIYSRDLGPFAGAGIGLILFGGLLAQIIIGLGTSIPGIMGSPQDSPAAILGVMAVAILAQMPGTPPESKFITVTAAVIITSIASGFFFLLIGIFKFGRFVRFIPYPVVGGFIAGTGFLLAQGAFGVMVGVLPQPSNFDLFITPENLLRWIPSLLFGIALVIGSRKYQHFLTIPILLTATVILFYGIMFSSGNSMADIRQAGWLLGPFPNGSLWKPLEISLFSQIRWDVLAGQAGNMAAIALISLVAMLLNANALELIAKKDLDLNRELIVAGFANLAGGMGGTVVSFHTLGFSAIPFRMKIASRWVAITAALTTAFVLLFGASLLSLVPMLIAGGVLFFLGISFLVEWVYDSWFQLPRIDYALVLLILIAVAGFGFLEGVATGLVIAVILFVVNYSRIDIVKNSLTGESFQSNTERPLEQRQLIKHLGQQIQILRLHGFVFFGTSQSLVARVNAYLKNSSGPQLKYLILDFQHVTALDSSAIFSFVRLGQLAETHKFHLVLTDLNENTGTRLRRAGVDVENPQIHFFQSLDHGMEWCESKLLLDEGGSTIIRSGSLRAQLKSKLRSSEQVDKFISYLAVMEVQESFTLIKKGDPPDAMYFIDSGELTTRLELSKDKFIRLRSQSGGTMVGEMGLFLKQARTADVVVSKPGILYRLAMADYERMMEHDADLAFHLHQWIVSVLSIRLAENNHTLEVLFG